MNMPDLQKYMFPYPARVTYYATLPSYVKHNSIVLITTAAKTNIIELFNLDYCHVKTQGP